MQNCTHLDQKVDRYSWWKVAVSTSTKLGCKGNGPGPAYIWNIAVENLVGCNTVSNCYVINLYLAAALQLDVGASKARGRKH